MITGRAKKIRHPLYDHHYDRTSLSFSIKPWQMEEDEGAEKKYQHFPLLTEWQAADFTLPAVNDLSADEEAIRKELAPFVLAVMKQAFAGVGVGNDKSEYRLKASNNDAVVINKYKNVVKSRITYQVKSFPVYQKINGVKQKIGDLNEPMEFVFDMKLSEDKTRYVYQLQQINVNNIHFWNMFNEGIRLDNDMNFKGVEKSEEEQLEAIINDEKTLIEKDKIRRAREILDTVKDMKKRPVAGQSDVELNNVLKYTREYITTSSDPGYEDYYIHHHAALELGKYAAHHRASAKSERLTGVIYALVAATLMAASVAAVIFTFGILAIPLCFGVLATSLGAISKLYGAHNHAKVSNAMSGLFHHEVKPHEDLVPVENTQLIV